MTAIEKDKEFVWHPYTQAKVSGDPIHITKAEGCKLYTADDKIILDVVSSWWVNIHGHANSLIADAISKQANILEQLIFAGFTHTPAIQLAESLVSVLPNNIKKIFYSDNGSTAVEVAIKMALQYYHNQNIVHKKVIIAFENAYHGDTFGAMSVSGKSAFNAPFQELLFEVKFIPLPTQDTIKHILETLQQILNKDDVAAFIYEPLIQGTAGMQIYEATLLNQILEFIQSKDVLLIADEVMTGFGRTGKVFASENMKILPDMICLSKGITGGFLPLGVTACTNEIYQMFYSNDRMKTFFHGHSYTANPLSCAAANASLKLLLEEKCLNQIQSINQHHIQFSNQLTQYNHVTNIRVLGTILAFDLVNHEQTSYFNHIRDKIYNFCLTRGVLIRPLGNIIYLMPPYCITPDELNYTYGVLEELLSEFKN